jgi:hypothetical protein
VNNDGAVGTETAVDIDATVDSGGAVNTSSPR